MRTRLGKVAISVLASCCVFGSAIAGDDDVNVKFVQLLDRDGMAVLVVEVTNTTSETIIAFKFGCWTEDRSKIESADVTGSRYMALNTGPIEWSGELGPNETATIEGIIAAMPGSMASMFSDQLFGCGTA